MFILLVPFFQKEDSWPADYTNENGEKNLYESIKENKLCERELSL